ncbi:Nucleolar and coiled-body phosphoprotein 1-like protein [Drosera capensis]
MHSSPAEQDTAAAAALSTTTTLFKPRQVLLLSLRSSSAMKKNPNTDLTAPAQSPSPDSKRMILNSICEYLEKNGFSKSVKKLRDEAKIEADSEEGGLLNLEALCNEKLKIRLTADDNKEKGEGKKEKKKKKETSDDDQLAITLEKTDIAIEEEEAKSKSKRKKEEAPVDDDLSAKEPKTTAKEKHSKKGKLQEDKTEDKKSLEKDKVSLERVAGEAEKDAALISEGKKQKEKKNKKNDASDGSEVESKEHRTEEARLAVVEGKEQTRGPTLVACSKNGDSARSAKKSKSQSKRKKEESPVPENSVANTTALANEEPNKKVDLPNSEAQTDEKRASKKRKNISKENGNGHILEKQKNDCLEEVKKSKEHKNMPLSENADDKVSKGEGEHDKISQSKEEKGKVSPPNLQTPSRKEADVISHKSGGVKSSQKNSVKQHSGSAEPRIVNAFQRVKSEEVEFIDERLQDNSYWAKDGADSGYGAKAQEILGQVKGRDFRHEKTKKKRGSYRGGLIDLQSHSVKFNYSDEE